MKLSTQGKGRLVERASGAIIETEWRLQKKQLPNTKGKDWDFDWSRPQKEGFPVYELFIKGNKDVQGRIAFRPEGGVTLAQLIESRAENRGRHGKYINVGSHLFAIAALISFQAGYDGWIAFEAKTDLIDHYRSIGAQSTFGPKEKPMHFETPAAKRLIDEHLEGGIQYDR